MHSACIRSPSDNAKLFWKEFDFVSIYTNLMQCLDILKLIWYILLKEITSQTNFFLWVQSPMETKVWFADFSEKLTKAQWPSAPFGCPIFQFTSLMIRFVLLLHHMKFPAELSSVADVQWSMFTTASYPACDQRFSKSISESKIRLLANFERQACLVVVSIETSFMLKEQQ